MGDDEARDAGVLAQLADELRVQAWLAAAEFRHPSLDEAGTREEVSALAQWRDRLRVQLHLGTLQAREEFSAVEERWGRLKEMADAQMDQAEEGLHDVLRDIRDRYHHLTTK